MSTSNLKLMTTTDLQRLIDEARHIIERPSTNQPALPGMDYRSQVPTPADQPLLFG